MKLKRRMGRSRTPEGAVRRRTEKRRLGRRRRRPQADHRPRLDSRRFPNAVFHLVRGRGRREEAEGAREDKRK